MPQWSSTSARWALSACILLIAMFTLAACGGDDESESTGSADAPASSESNEPTDPLTIAGWGGAYTKATQNNFVKPWSEEGGVGAKFVDAPGTQVAKLEAEDRAGNVETDLFDAVVAGDAFTLWDKGLLAPLPDDVKANLVEAVGEDKISDFGLISGSTAFAIVCNKEKVGTCPKNMTEFFDVEKFPQTRGMPAVAPMSVVTMALVAEGKLTKEDAPTAEPDLDAAFAALDRIKPTVKVFWESGDQSEQIMRSGEVDLGLFYSTRGFRLAEQGMDVETAWDGAVYEASYWAVTKDSDQPNAGFSLIEFIATHPENQAGFAEEIGYSVPSPEAIELMPEEEAKKSPDYPANFEQLVQPNWAWYVANNQDVNKRWEAYVRG